MMTSKPAAEDATLNVTGTVAVTQSVARNIGITETPNVNVVNTPNVKLTGFAVEVSNTASAPLFIVNQATPAGSVMSQS